MKENALILFLCITSICLYAQDNTLDYQISSRQLSPQAYELVRHGSIPVKHFVGELDFSIPLYTYQDRDFTIPIVLQYNGNGFKPNKNEGMIGLDWSLNLGGAIIRNVQGLPDEGSDATTLGVLAATRIGLYKYDIPFNDKVTKTSVPDLANAIPANYIAHWNTNISNLSFGDLSPDEFSFCMPGHSGKFYIGWDGNIQIVGNKPYQVTFSDLFTASSTASSRYITIISPDGYRYVFGGQDEAEETSTYFPDQANLSNQKTIRTAWFLRKIIAPNQRKVEFVYRPSTIPSVGYNYDYVYTSGDPSLVLIQDMIGITQGSPELSERGMETGPFLSLQDKNDFTYELVRQSSLDKIIVDGKTVIQFYYKEKERTFYADNEIVQSLYKAFNKKNMQMIGIDVSYDNTVIKKISLQQEYLGTSSNSRLFLTSLVCGENKYSFDYYNLDKIPRPCLTEIDHWGYYNGKPYLIPHLKVSMDGMNIIIDDDKQRVADEELCKVGMLRKVLYPTGGESLFYYGLHSWNYMVRRGYSTQEEVSDNFPGEAFPREIGGARINKIEDVDMNGNVVNTREFIYNKGILLGYPNYLKEIFPIRPNAIFADFYTNIMGKSTYPNEKYIQYAEVTEKNSTNGSTTFRFTSYLDVDNRDQFDITPATYSKILVDSYDQWPPLLGFRGDNRSYRRGLLTEKIHYDNNSNIVSRDKIQYAMQNSSEQNYIMALYKENFLTNKYKIENYAYLPVKVEHYDIRNGMSTITTKQVEYNDKYLIKKETEIENSLTTEYKYPYDLREITPYNEMVNKNILSPVLEKRVSKSGVMLRQETTNYSAKNYDGNVLYLPSAIYSQNGSGTERILNARFDVYDNYGNVIAVTGKDNVSKVYVWGYKGKYPVVEIKNATYTQVKSALSNITPESLSQIDTPDISTLDRLRDNNDLKDSYITTYTYKPLVGILTNTTPDKNTIYYGYDNFNRLISSQDYSNHLLTSIIYNLVYTIPMTIKLNINETYSFGSTANFLVDVEGGSGEFLYDWYVKNATSQSVIAQQLNSSSRSFNAILTQEGTMNLTCRVKDNRTGQIVEKTILFTVLAPPLQIAFTNIVTSDNPPYTKIMTAEINCDEITSLKFLIGISASSGSANYRIGTSSYQISSSGSQSVNVTLPKGKNTVELRLYKPSSGSSSAWIVIDAVNSGNNTIGIDRTLRINM